MSGCLAGQTKRARWPPPLRDLYVSVGLASLTLVLSVHLLPAALHLAQCQQALATRFHSIACSHSRD
ncbi:hypothetical protein BDZ90DRAFT_2303 [Jaminaea rosea]|uniref:Uncharacterized protein n=1 Tax=Jaminaea rosea TaxID=1569628 RepID=A0A316UYB3_9BASI|nr:hypothetical protein BDZ90DRAFT_2303 [Jaminaea rosea]PWN29984.1 hypothetical protein BDZ90DRAFT_2303 [Jaminaea rosea]